MKKAVRLYLQGSVQGMFFKQYIKEQADKINVQGFLRLLEDGRMEIFIEGDIDNVNSFVEVCKLGPKNAQIRNIEEKPERFQEFKEFKILNI
jgi:acylphosphatase